MNTIQRNYCAVTAEEIIPIYEIKNFPVLMNCTEQKREADLYAPLTFAIGKEFGCIQLRSLMPLDILYSSQHGAGSVGNIWFEHHQKFADFIHYAIPNNVFEIGGYHGILSKIYIDKYKKIPWIIFDPQPNPLSDTEAVFIKGFFDSNIKELPQDCTLIHSHVLEHLYEPRLFFEHISKLLKRGQKHIFSIPNMNVMLNEKHGNMLNFEHTVCLQEDYIEYLLIKNSFKILEKQYFKNDHSIFYMTEKSNEQYDIIDKIHFYEQNKQKLNNYINHFLSFSSDINKKISESRSKIYLFGAHITSQFLISMGLNTENIFSIIDNDHIKQEKRLYGTNLTVKSPKILSSEKDPMVILVPGAYNNEIKKDIISNINRNTIFIES